MMLAAALCLAYTVLGRAMASASAELGAAVVSKPPVHLIHVLADDLGYNDVSWHNPIMKTPVLQSLQESGVHLAQLHTWKACAPSRGSIMSGRYPFHYGFCTRTRPCAHAPDCPLACSPAQSTLTLLRRPKSTHL